MVSQYQVYINRLLADIGDDFEVPITFQILNLLTGDIPTSNYTKAVYFPITDNNLKIFGFPNILESSSVVTREDIPIIVIKNGIEIISNGYCIFSAIDNNRIETNIFFGLYSLYKDIEDKTLQDLNLSELDHDWNKSNIDSLGAYNPTLAPLVYALIEWGEKIAAWIDPEEEVYEEGWKNLTGIMNYQSMLPSVKASYLINKLISDAGYKVIDGDLTTLLPSPYNNMYIPIVTIKPDSVTEYQAGQHKAIMTSDHSTAFWYLLNLIGWLGGGYQGILFDSYTENHFNQCFTSEFEIPGAGFSHYFTSYRVGCNGNYSFSTLLAFAALTEEHAQVTLRISIVVSDGNPITYEDGNYQQNWTVIEQEEVIVGNVDPVDVYVNGSSDLAAGDVVSIIVERIAQTLNVMPDLNELSTLGGVSYFETLYYVPTIPPILYPRTPILEEVGYGYNLPIAINLPEIKQSDFLKTILGYFGAILVPGKHDRTVSLKYIKDIFKNTGNAVNWTEKIDYSSIKIVHLLDSLGKKNWFKYTDPSDDEKILNPDPDPNAYFEISNGKLLEDDKDFLKSPFIPSKMVQRVKVDLYMPQITLMDAGFNQIKKPKPRILLIDLFTTSTAIRYRTELEDVDRLITGSHDELRAFFQLDEPGNYSVLADGKTLNYGEYIDAHYEELVALYNNFKMIEVFVHLDEKDITLFSHFDPVWIEKHHSYFYINRIIDYIDDLAKVELIKLY